MEFKFMPESIAVTAGTKVTWTNRDAAPHTATARDPEPFDTENLNKGQSKTLVLASPGTYSYVCDFHPFMTGKIVVR